MTCDIISPSKYRKQRDALRKSANSSPLRYLQMSTSSPFGREAEIWSCTHGIHMHLLIYLQLKTPGVSLSVTLKLETLCGVMQPTSLANINQPLHCPELVSPLWTSFIKCRSNRASLIGICTHPAGGEYVKNRIGYWRLANSKVERSMNDTDVSESWLCHGLSVKHSSPSRLLEFGVLQVLTSAHPKSWSEYIYLPLQAVEARYLSTNPLEVHCSSRPQQKLHFFKHTDSRSD